MGGGDLTKGKYLHPNATAYTHTTTAATIITTSTITTATKAKATTINSDATTTIAAIEIRDIKAKIWNILQLYGTNRKTLCPYSLSRGRI